MRWLGWKVQLGQERGGVFEGNPIFASGVIKMCGLVLAEDFDWQMKIEYYI